MLLADRYETPFSKTFWNDFLNDRNYFSVYLFDRLHYKVFVKPDYMIFNKFIYVQLFRASISNHEAFISINLKTETLDILKSNLLEIAQFHDFSVIAITTYKNPDTTSNVYLGLKLTEKDISFGLMRFFSFLILNKEKK